MARAVNGFPLLWTWIAPSEINVLPVPHSAITIAVFARCQRLATPMMAKEFIREVRIEDRVSFSLPPIPVLDDGIERDVLFAVVICNPQNLILGVAPVPEDFSVT